MRQVIEKTQPTPQPRKRRSDAEYAVLQARAVRSALRRLERERMETIALGLRIHEEAHRAAVAMEQGDSEAAFRALSAIVERARRVADTWRELGEVQ